MIEIGDLRLEAGDRIKYPDDKKYCYYDAMENYEEADLNESDNINYLNKMAEVYDKNGKGTEAMVIHKKLKDFRKNNFS